MLIHPMAERLRGLGLTAMADAFLDMHNQSAADDLSREDWLGLLIDREVTARDNKLQNSVQNFPDSGGKQRPIVSTLVHAIIRRFRRRIWGVVHGYDCRDPAPSFGQQGEHQFDRA